MNKVRFIRARLAGGPLIDGALRSLDETPPLNAGQRV